MATLHIETTAEDKSLWVRAAQLAPAKGGPGLAPWVIETLNKAAEKAVPLNLTIDDNHSAPVTWEEFASDNAEMDPTELAGIRADLMLTGLSKVGGGSAPLITIRRVPHSQLKHY